MLGVPLLHLLLLRLDPLQHRLISQLEWEEHCIQVVQRHQFLDPFHVGGSFHPVCLRDLVPELRNDPDLFLFFVQVCWSCGEVAAQDMWLESTCSSGETAADIPEAEQEFFGGMRDRRPVKINEACDVA